MPKITLKGDIDIKKRPLNIEVLGMVLKPVRGTTEEGKTIYLYQRYEFEMI